MDGNDVLQGVLYVLAYLTIALLAAAAVVALLRATNAEQLARDCTVAVNQLRADQADLVQRVAQHQDAVRALGDQVASLWNAQGKQTAVALAGDVERHDAELAALEGVYPTLLKHARALDMLASSVGSAVPVVPFEDQLREHARKATDHA